MIEGIIGVLGFGDSRDATDYVMLAMVVCSNSSQSVL